MAVIAGGSGNDFLIGTSNADIRALRHAALHGRGSVDLPWSEPGPEAVDEAAHVGIGRRWDLGFPAIMITDTANRRNPHYHQASDCIDTLDLAFPAGVCRGLITGLSTL